MTLRTNLHELLENNEPYFINDKLKCFDRSVFSKYEWVTHEEGAGVIDLSKVIGTAHYNYHGNTWSELLPTNQENYKHLEVFLSWKEQGRLARGWQAMDILERNPDYFISDKVKDNLSYFKVGDEYYINGGNHRTIIGRFLLYLNGREEIIKGVNITEVIIPEDIVIESMSIRQKLLKHTTSIFHR